MTHLLIGWRAGDLIVIMDGGQHGPPRREVWSYHHPSSKQSSPIHHDNFEPSLLTCLSRVFQRSHYCNGLVPAVEHLDLEPPFDPCGFVRIVLVAERFRRRALSRRSSRRRPESAPEGPASSFSTKHGGVLHQKLFCNNRFYCVLYVKVKFPQRYQNSHRIFRNILMLKELAAILRLPKLTLV